MQKVEFWCVEVEFSDRGESFPVCECETAEEAIEAYVRKNNFAKGTAIVAQGITEIVRKLVK